MASSGAPNMSTEDTEALSVVGELKSNEMSEPPTDSLNSLLANLGASTGQLSKFSELPLLPNSMLLVNAALSSLASIQPLDTLMNETFDQSMLSSIASNNQQPVTSIPITSTEQDTPVSSMMSGSQLVATSNTPATSSQPRVGAVDVSVFSSLLNLLPSVNKHTVTSTLPVNVSTPTVNAAPPLSMAPSQSMAPPLSMAPSQTMAPPLSMGPPQSMAPSQTMPPPLSMAPSQTMAPPLSMGPPQSMAPSQTMAPSQSMDPPLLMGPSQSMGPTIVSAGPHSGPRGVATTQAIVRPSPLMSVKSPPCVVSPLLTNTIRPPKPVPSSTAPTIPQIVASSNSRPFPGQVTAEILTHFKPPVTKTTPPQSRVSAGEILASVTGHSDSAPRTTRVGTPALQAHEQLLSDDDDLSDEEMDTQPPPSTTGDNHIPVAPTVAVVATKDPTSSSRSDSPCVDDDDSFADFLAREVHESALERRGSSSSRSPTPSLADITSRLQGGPGLSRFGVTASCPPAPVQLPDGSVNASLDMTSRNFPKRSKYAHRAAISAMHPYNRTRGGGASVAKTLDLLKAVLQSSFNMEVKRLCDDYQHIFSQAASNVRDNTGDSVPDATIRLLVCKMIEEAQQGYIQGKWEFPYGKLPRSVKVVTPTGSPMSTKKLKAERVESRYGPPKRIRKPPAERGTDKSAVWKWGMDKRRLDPGKWEPEKMTSNTVFCLGVNVNKALGHSANRGKVYYLHPELFKYACDGDDKTWLYENKFLPVHGGKAFLMIFHEVSTLVTTEDLYKDVPDVVASVGKLQQFRVPQFMVDKMKSFMKSVQGYFAQEANGAAATQATKP